MAIQKELGPNAAQKISGGVVELSKPIEKKRGGIKIVIAFSNKFIRMIPMYSCPACNELTISYFRKWCSRPALPANCSACGGYSHADQSSGGVALVVAIVGITASGILASALLALWPLLCGVAAAIVFYIWHWHQVKLEVLSPDLVSRARKTETMTTIALLLTLFVS